MTKKSLVPSLPFSGNISCQLSERGSLRCWTYDSLPTHNIGILNGYNTFEERVAAIVIMCEDKDSAEEQAELALKNKEYGKLFVYKCETFNSTYYGYGVHFPRYQNEKSGFINFHAVRNAVPIQPETIVYFQ